MIADANGVHIRVVSRHLLDAMSTPEKVRFILDEVQARRVLVLEGGLEPHEAVQLIARAMAEIEPDGFSGLEMESTRLRGPAVAMHNRFTRLLARLRPPSRITIIAPADALRTLKRSPQTMDALVIPGRAASGGVA